jgi:hypothetical protein
MGAMGTDVKEAGNDFESATRTLDVEHIDFAVIVRAA